MLKALLSVVLVAVMASAANAADEKHNVMSRLYEASVVSINPKAHAIKLNVETDNGIKTITVATNKARPAVATLQVGDQVQAKLVLGSKPEMKDSIRESHYFDWPSRCIALTVSFALLFGMATLAASGDPRRFLIGVDNRYSKSQVQFAVWAALAGAAYLATLLLRARAGSPVGGIGLTNNLLLLSGLSAISFGAAKAITTTKVDVANAALASNAKTSPGGKGPPPDVAPPAVPAKNTANKPQLRDMVTNDVGAPDLGDFQMITITAIAAAIYLWQVFVWLGPIKLAPTVNLPDVDTFLLASFGIGQGAYLAKKAVLPVGQG